MDAPCLTMDPFQSHFNGLHHALRWVIRSYYWGSISIPERQDLTAGNRPRPSTATQPNPTREMMKAVKRDPGGMHKHKAE